MNRLSLLFLAVVATSAAACVTADGKSGGGGWIPSTVPGAKATFGFHSKCDTAVDIDGYHIGKSSLSYKDHGANVSFKVAQLSLDDSTHANSICGVGGLDEFYGSAGFVGVYTPQPASAGPGGLVLVAYIDNGIAGESPDDAIGVQLQGGIYDGYTNAQPLAQGQIHISAE